LRASASEISSRLAAEADANQAERREAQGSLARERKRNLLAPCRRQQQRERQQAAEPRRRGDQMQPVGRAMEGAEPTGRRRGVTGMDQRRGERAGEQRRDHPARQIEVLWGDPTQGCGKQRRQHEPREPIMSEGGVEEHRPHNTADESFAWHALADVRGEHHQPRHARDQRGGKTPPGNAQQPRAQDFTRTLHLPHDRSDDRGAEDDGARQRQCRRKMERAYVDERITHPVPPGRRRAPNSRRTYLPTRKLYSPLVAWVSTEITRHSTL